MKSESKSAPRSKLDAKLTSTNLLSRQQRLSIARKILSLSGLLSCVDAFSEGRGLGTRREEDPGWPLVAEAQSLPSILSRDSAWFDSLGWKPLPERYHGFIGRFATLHSDFVLRGCTPHHLTAGSTCHGRSAPSF